MHKNCAFLMFTLTFALQMHGASAQERYVVGVEDLDYYPHYRAKDGTYDGFGRTVLDAFADDTGVIFEYRPLPVARLFQSFLAGDVDLKYPDNAYWAADAKDGRGVVYSSPVVGYTDGVSVRPEAVGQPVSEIEVLGTVQGFTAWDWLDRMENETVQIAENPNFTALIRQAILGRVDGAYANVSVVRYRLERDLEQPGALVFDPSLPHTTSAYHLSAIAHAPLIVRFDAWLADNADRLARLKAEYGVEE